MNRKEEPWEAQTKQHSAIPKILCIVLALLVVLLSAVCVYYMKVNAALAHENIVLSGEIYRVEQEVKRLEGEIADLKKPKQQEGGFSLDAYINERNNWQAAVDAGLTELTFEEWWEIVGNN